MRWFPLLLLTLALFGLAGLAQEKKAPDKLVFETKMGAVTFNHVAHVQRAGGDCKVCHDKFWPQSAKAPLNFKANLHKTAVANQTSCGFCHRPEGKAFQPQGNCNKCHVKGAKG